MLWDLPGPLLPLRGSSPTRTVCLLKEEPSGCAAPFIMVGRKRTLMGNASVHSYQKLGLFPEDS